MAILRCQMCFQGPALSAEDMYCNTWHMNYSAGTIDENSQGVGLTILNALFAFYDEWAPWRAASTAEAGSTLKIYDISDPPESPPRYHYTYTNAVPWTDVSSGVPLPTEVALCLSFEGILGPGFNRPRRRGRVYLGPFGSDAIANGTTISRPAAGLLAAAEVGYANMRDTLNTNNIDTGLYSPTDEVFVETHHWWLDDAWDTQRRRGAAPSQRITGTA